MTKDVVAHMRSRIERVRKVIELAHDQEMIAMLEAMIEEAEQDIRRLERDEDHPTQEGGLTDPSP